MNQQEWDEKSAEFKEGYEAGIKKIPRYENPYPLDSQAAKDWELGRWTWYTSQDD